MIELNDPVPPLRILETIPVREKGKEFVLLRDPQGFSEKILAFAPEVLPILTLFDGSRTVDDILEYIEASIGEKFPRENLLELVDLMEDARFLQSQSFNEDRIRIENEFKNSTVRQAVLAGNGYPDDQEKLEQELNHYLDAPPPDDFEGEPVPDGKLRGMILPHIDFIRGGPTFGRGYRILQEKLKLEENDNLLVGILGVAHNGSIAPVVIADKDFETPLGVAKHDRDAIKTIRSELGESYLDEQWIHRYEHSVELQVVWLQYLLAGRKFNILPILVSSFPEVSSEDEKNREKITCLIDVLIEVEKNHDGPVIWIASVDFAHVGQRFGDPFPVDKSVANRIAKQDMVSLDSIRNVDPDSWWSSIMEKDNERKVCGLYATYLLLSVLKDDKTTGSVIDYQQAIPKDESQLVSYSAVSFIEQEKSSE